MPSSALLVAKVRSLTIDVKKFDLNLLGLKDQCEFGQLRMTKKICRGTKYCGPTQLVEIKLSRKFVYVNRDYFGVVGGEKPVFIYNGTAFKVFKSANAVGCVSPLNEMFSKPTKCAIVEAKQNFICTNESKNRNKGQTVLRFTTGFNRTKKHQLIVCGKKDDHECEFHWFDKKGKPNQRTSVLMGNATYAVSTKELSYALYPFDDDYYVSASSSGAPMCSFIYLITNPLFYKKNPSCEYKSELYCTKFNDKLLVINEKTMAPVRKTIKCNNKLPIK